MSIFTLICTYNIETVWSKTDFPKKNIIILIQGNTEKCTGAFKFGCRVTFYSSKSCRKSGLIRHLFPQKIFKFCFNSIKKKNICKFIILNVHNDPCFEDKSSSLTLKYRPVHFSESSCISNRHNSYFSG